MSRLLKSTILWMKKAGNNCKVSIFLHLFLLLFFNFNSSKFKKIVKKQKKSCGHTMCVKDVHKILLWSKNQFLCAKLVYLFYIFYFIMATKFCYEVKYAQKNQFLCAKLVYLFYIFYMVWPSLKSGWDIKTSSSSYLLFIFLLIFIIFLFIERRIIHLLFNCWMLFYACQPFFFWWKNFFLKKL